MSEDTSIEGNNTGGGDLDVDIASASDSLARELGLGAANSADGSASSLPDAEKDTDSDPEPATPVVKTAVPDAPKSWPKEAAPLWAKLDQPTRDMVVKRETDFLNGIEQYKGDSQFAKSIRDTLAPYQALMTAQNITDPAVAVKGLLNAHYQLSNADEAGRTQFMANLLKQYKIDPVKLSEAFGDEKPLQDPAFLKLQQQVDSLASGVTAEQTRKLADAKAKVTAEVNAFAADPAHAYFNEVAPDMMLLLQDPNIDLAEAYKRAVRANPNTWAKEEARLREEVEADIRKRAKEQARKSEAARGTNVRGAEHQGAPTEPVGSMEDTMRETYRAIQTRT